MREAIKQAARALPVITAIPRFKRLDAAAFRAKAAQGVPFLITGVVDKWPLTAMPPQVLREQFSAVPVRARVGDYVNTAFAADRAMADMTMGEYLDLVDRDETALPPYLGNLGLQELNRHCHWPAYFDKMGPPRFWIGPARCVTPLHCDFDDNIFAQIWGRKRIFLAPPHHDELLYAREASSLLFGSPFDPGVARFRPLSAGAAGESDRADRRAGRHAVCAGWLVSPGARLDILPVVEPLGAGDAAGAGRQRRAGGGGRLVTGRSGDRQRVNALP